MPSFKKPLVYQSIPAIIFSTFLVMIVIYGWSEPSSAPPTGNASAPLNVSTTTQYKGGALGVGGVFQADNVAIFNGSIKIADGTQGVGKVLTSDASGLANWQTASGGTFVFPNPYLNEWTNEQYIDDNNPATPATFIRSQSPCQSNSGSLQYDLGTPKHWRMRMDSQVSTPGTPGPALFVQYSDDGANWYNIATQGNGGIDRFYLSMYSRYIRFYASLYTQCTDVPRTNSVYIYEIYLQY